MKSRFKLFQSVIAARDIVEPDLMGAWGRGKPGLVNGKPGVLKGTRGAVVEIFEEPGGLAVEFFDAAGETIDVAFVPEAYVRAATKPEQKAARDAGVRAGERRAKSAVPRTDHE